MGLLLLSSRSIKWKRTSVSHNFVSYFPSLLGFSHVSSRGFVLFRSLLLINLSFLPFLPSFHAVPSHKNTLNLITIRSGSKNYAERFSTADVKNQAVANATKFTKLEHPIVSIRVVSTFDSVCSCRNRLLMQLKHGICHKETREIRSTITSLSGERLKKLGQGNAREKKQIII